MHGISRAVIDISHITISPAAMTGRNARGGIQSTSTPQFLRKHRAHALRRNAPGGIQSTSTQDGRSGGHLVLESFGRNAPGGIQSTSTPQRVGPHRRDHRRVVMPLGASSLLLPTRSLAFFSTSMRVVMPLGASSLLLRLVIITYGRQPVLRRNAPGGIQSTSTQPARLNTGPGVLSPVVMPLGASSLLLHCRTTSQCRTAGMRSRNAPGGIQSTSTTFLCGRQRRRDSIRS